MTITDLFVCALFLRDKSIGKESISDAISRLDCGLGQHGCFINQAAVTMLLSLLLFLINTFCINTIQLCKACLQ